MHDIIGTISICRYQHFCWYLQPICKQYHSFTFKNQICSNVAFVVSPVFITNTPSGAGDKRNGSVGVKRRFWTHDKKDPWEWYQYRWQWVQKYMISAKVYYRASLDKVCGSNPLLNSSPKKQISIMADISILSIIRHTWHCYISIHWLPLCVEWWAKNGTTTWKVLASAAFTCAWVSNPRKTQFRSGLPKTGSSLRKPQKHGAKRKRFTHLASH